MPGARATLIAGSLLACSLLGACTTTTNGVGIARLPVSGGSSSQPQPGPTAPGSGPSGSSGTPGGPGGRPPSCPVSSCHLRLSGSLSRPYSVAVWADDAQPATIVALTAGSSNAGSETLADQSPAQLSCMSNGELSHCIVVDQIGAHSSIGYLLRVRNGALALGPSVQAATPTMQAADLNQDGWIDIAGLQNDYTPNYASGQVYWQTWVSDGTQLRSTGCGALGHAASSPPTAPLTGKCP